MFKISKRLEISASHSLQLSYESKCENLHGHNWIVTIFVKGEELNQDGMLIDFTHIKKFINDKLDHKNLNEIFKFNTTAENIAYWIRQKVNNLPMEKGVVCYKVIVQESEGNIAEYEL